MRWLFLRGLTREARHWGNFPDVFRTFVPDADITLLDLPGSGALWAEKSPASVAEMVEHCRKEMRERGTGAPISVLAISLGAMVAADWATRYPEEITAAVLINTSLRPFNPLHQRLQPHNYASLLRLLLPGTPPETRERTILRITSNKAPKPDSVIETWCRYHREQPVSGRNALRQIMAAARYHAPATPPAAPILILASEGDRLVDCRCSKQLAKAWQTDLALHPEAGHDLPLDAPEWLASTVKQWLDRRKRG